MVDLIQEYLKDEIELEYGKSLTKNQRIFGDVPVYGSNGIVGYNNKSCFKGPGIIIGRKGTVGNIKYEQKDFWAIDTTYVVKLKDKNQDLKFWYYFLQTLGLENMNSHSAIPGLNRDRVYDLIITIPKEIKQRKRIAKILSDIDLKIKINVEMNDNLLEIALTLLNKEHTECLEFDVLGNIIKFIKGKKPNDINSTKKNNYEKYLTIACLNNQESNFANISNMVIAESNVLMVMDGASSGDVYFSNYGIVGSTLAKVDITNNNYISEFIYFILKKYNELIKSKNTGSAIPHTDKEFVNSLKVPKIRLEEQDKYKIILSKILKNQEQNEILTRLRDTLLPKLMNGEINIDKIEI